MRRKTLTLGVLLVLVAVLVLEQGVQVFVPLAQISGLSGQYTKEEVVVAPTLYSVPAANYSFSSQNLAAGVEYVGLLQVADSRQVGFYVMSEGNFSLWRSGHPASLVLANPNAISYNFTVAPSVSGTYYFVWQNEENTPLTIVFSLSSIQNVTVLNPLVEYAGIELLVLGMVLCFFGLRGGAKKQRKRAEESVESGWKCKFCGARNAENEAFCIKCSRSRS
jgi:hypothetical protein